MFHNAFRMKIYSYAYKKECEKAEECASKLKPFFKDEESIVKNLSKNESFILRFLNSM